MKSSVLSSKLSSNRDFLIRASALALLFIFAAHAFCFFNLTYSGESVMLNAAKGSGAQTSGGRYLQPFYWRVRGEISASLWVGLLSALYLTLSVLLIALMLDIKRISALFALSGALIVNPAVTSLCAASLHTADAAFLSMLLGAAGAALCTRTRWGFLPGMLLFAASPALSAAGPAFAAALSLIVLMKDLMDRLPRRALLIRAGKTAAALAAGAALYLAGYGFLLWAYDLSREAALQPPAGGSLLGAWLYPIRTLFAPLTAYTRLNVLLRALLLLTGAAALARRMRDLTAARGAALLVCALLLPLAVNLPVFAREGTGQTSLSFALLDVLLIVLLFGSGDQPLARGQSCGGFACAFAVLFLSGVVFSNQVYLKKNLEYESTLSAMTRVLERIEQTEGYAPGYTPVAIVGTLEESVLSVPHEGFEHLSALDAAKNNYAADSYEGNIWYMWEIMGYPLNFISSFEQSQLEESETVRAMPAFPQEGCCGFVGDTLVIKLSS